MSVRVDMVSPAVRQAEPRVGRTSLSSTRYMYHGMRLYMEMRENKVGMDSEEDCLG